MHVKAKEYAFMLKYILKRIVMIIPVMLAVSLIVFCMMDLVPTDPAITVLGDQATEADLEAYREAHGLNDPLLVRYVRYMAGALKGDLGTSYATGKPVWELYFAKFPYSLKLALMSMAIATLLALPLGIIAAVKEGSFIDNLCSITTFVGVAMPSFWFALILMLLFAVKLQWLPATGANHGIVSLIMPSLAVGIINCATVARTTRSAMLDAMSSDYLRTARSKGVAETDVITNHALKNASIPIVTMIGTSLTAMLGGSIVIERVFAWPGTGSFLIDSVQKNDYPVVTGFLILLSFFVSISLLIVDLIYAFLDPRIKAQYTNK